MNIRWDSPAQIRNSFYQLNEQSKALPEKQKEAADQKIKNMLRGLDQQDRKNLKKILSTTTPNIGTLQLEKLEKNLSELYKESSSEKPNKQKSIIRGLKNIFWTRVGSNQLFSKASHLTQKDVAKGFKADIYANSRPITISNPIVEKKDSSSETSKDANQKLASKEYKLAKQSKNIDEKAIAHYQSAANLGHAKAQFELGMCYEDGTGVTKNDETALKYYCLASKQGLAEAQFAMGSFYAEGVAVKQNSAKAAGYYQLAAKQGLAAAQTELGLLYEEGHGGFETNLETAVKYYELAANQGEDGAQFHLGRYYHNIDPERSRKYYELSAAQGNESAQSALRLLNKKAK